MGAPILTPQQRLRIAGEAAHRSQRSVAAEYGIAQSTVAYCVTFARVQAALPPAVASGASERGLTTPRLPPATTKLDNETLQVIRASFENDPFATNRDVLTNLAAQGILISVNTLRRARRKLGYRRCVALLKPFLSALAMEKRLAYAQKHTRTFMEWRKVIFTDEVPLYLDQQYQAFVTRPLGSKRTDARSVLCLCVANTQVHPIRVQIRLQDCHVLGSDLVWWQV